MGFRKSQAAAAFFYLLWILAASSANPWLLAAAGLPAGLSAAVVWNGMATYVILGTDPEKYNHSFGKILTSYGLGACLGLIAISFMLSLGLTLSQTFMAVGVGALISILLFSRLDEIEGAPEAPKFREVLATFKNPTVIRLASLPCPSGVKPQSSRCKRSM